MVFHEFNAGMFEEAAITLRKLYGEDASLCLEARATERLAEMMLDAGRAERAYGKIRRVLLVVVAKVAHSTKREDDVTCQYMPSQGRTEERNIV